MCAKLNSKHWSSFVLLLGRSDISLVSQSVWKSAEAVRYCGGRGWVLRPGHDRERFVCQGDLSRGVPSHASSCSRLLQWINNWKVGLHFVGGQTWRCFCTERSESIRKHRNRYVGRLELDGPAIVWRLCDVTVLTALLTVIICRCLCHKL